MRLPGDGVTATPVQVLDTDLETDVDFWPALQTEVVVELEELIEEAPGDVKTSESDEVEVREVLETPVDDAVTPAVVVAHCRV